MTKPKRIYELVGISKERLELLIPLLVETQQKIIKEKFDNNYERIKEIEWTKREIYTYSISIINRLRVLNERYDENINNKLQNPFCNLIGASKKEILKELPRFREDIQKFIYDHFNKNLDFKTNYDDWSEDEKKFYYDCICYVGKALNQSTRAFASLHTKLNLSKSELEEISLLLSPACQEVIYKYYDEDFKPKLNVPWVRNDQKYFWSFAYNRISLIKENKHSKTFKWKINNLMDHLNVTSYQLRYLIRLLKEEYRILINKVFDEKYNLKSDIKLTTHDMFIITVFIVPELKNYINQFEFHQINQQAKLEKAKEIYENIKTPIDNYVSYNQEVLNAYKTSINCFHRYSVIKEIHALRSYYLKAKEIIKNSETKLTLERKKN